MADLNQLLGLTAGPVPQGTRDPDGDLILRLLELADPQRGSGVALGAVPTTAELPGPAPTPQPAPDLGSILAQREPLSKTEAITGTLADALRGFLAVKRGLPLPQNTAIEKMTARRQSEADRQTEINLAQERFRRQDVGEATRQRERGEDRRLLEQDRAALRSREDTLLAEEIARGDEASLRAIQDRAASLGAKGTDQMDRAAALDAIAKARRDEISQLAPRDLQRQEEAFALASGVRNQYIRGEPQAQIAPLAERIAAGESAEDIIRQFMFDLDEVPGLSERDKELMALRLQSEIDRLMEMRQQNATLTPGGPTLVPNPMTGFPVPIPTSADINRAYSSAVGGKRRIRSPSPRAGR